jgi:DNA invertase Pin-like site-specific DNA recombinase
LEITKFIRVEVSSGSFLSRCNSFLENKSIRQRKLEFLNTLKKGDILICTETSRLSRSLSELLRIVEGLLSEQVRLIFVMQGLDIKDLSNPTTKLTLHIFSMIAEHERSVISQRTKEALRVLKERGMKLGKPRGISTEIR